jgi:hypothetical protein
VGSIFQIMFCGIPFHELVELGVDLAQERINVGEPVARLLHGGLHALPQVVSAESLHDAEAQLFADHQQKSDGDVVIALVVAQMRILDNHLQDENGELVLQGKTLLVRNARGKALQRPVHIQDHLIVLAMLGQLRQERSLVQTVRVDFQQQRPYSAPQIICQNETFTSLSQNRRALPPTSPNGSIAKSCHVFSVELLLLRACSINSRFFRSAADSSSASGARLHPENSNYNSYLCRTSVPTWCLRFRRTRTAARTHRTSRCSTARRSPRRDCSSRSPAPPL